MPFEINDTESYTGGDTLRKAWIARASEFITRRNGVPCTYNPPVKYDGGIDKDTRRKYKPIWDNVYCKAASTGLDPILLTNMLFQWWNNFELPTPYMIYSDMLISKVRDLRRRAAANAGAQLVRDSTSFQLALHRYSYLYLDPSDARTAAVTAADTGVSPLYRLVAADRYKLGSAVDEYVPAAKDQFNLAPAAYTKCWASVLSNDVLKRLDAAQN